VTAGWLLFVIFSVLVALFAGQNTDLVVIRFFGWEGRYSQAVVILVSAAGGALVALAGSLVQRVRFNLRLWDMQARMRKLEEEKRGLAQRLEEAEKAAPQAAAQTVSPGAPQAGSQGTTQAAAGRGATE